MSRQAQAERERQARIIGTAETGIAHKFVEAADARVAAPAAQRQKTAWPRPRQFQSRGSERHGGLGDRCGAGTSAGQWGWYAQCGEALLRRAGTLRWKRCDRLFPEHQCHW